MSGLEKALFNLKVWKQYNLSLNLVSPRAADLLANSPILRLK
jgi:hypothetical protein